MSGIKLFHITRGLTWRETLGLTAAAALAHALPAFANDAIGSSVTRHDSECPVLPEVFLAYHGSRG